MTEDDVAIVALAVDFQAAFSEARQRFVNDATMPLDFNEHLVRVGAEHAARAAIPSIRDRVLEEAARCVEGYPSPLDDLNMAVAVRGIANAVRNLKEQG